MRYRLSTVLIAVSAVCVLLAARRYWEYLPGTFYRDQNGFPHGTGVDRYFYQAGPMANEEHYWGGILRKITYYHPDGSVVVTSRFDTAKGGVGYALWDDGTIKMKYESEFVPADRTFRANGEAVYYDRAGNVIKVTRFRDGVEISE